MRRARSRSLRVQVTALAAVLTSVPLLVIALFALHYLRDQAMRFENAEVRWRSLCTWVALKVDSVPQELQELERLRWKHRTQQCVEGRRVESEPVRIGDITVEGITDADKVLVSESLYLSAVFVPNLSLWPFTDPTSIDHTEIYDSGERVVLPRDLRMGSNDEQIVAQLQQVQRTLNHRALSLITASLGVAALLTAVVWWATGRVLAPVEAIRRELRDITEHDLNRRVPTSGARNEIARLAATLNTTLDRLQTAVEDNRRFVADASHELRSPIAALRAELEIAHAHPGLTDWPTVLGSALEDTYRLQDLAADLLLLARLEHDSPTSAVAVDLTDLIRDETSRRRTHHLTELDLPEQPVTVTGSRALLGRLLGNLLDNAERHATSRITIRLARDDHHAIVDVIDDGPGIPTDQHERIFDRFTRLDDARSRSTGGTGLGLAIVRRIAATHSGTVRVVRNNAGAHFTATLPLTAPTPIRHPDRN